MNEFAIKARKYAKRCIWTATLKLAVAVVAPLAVNYIHLPFLADWWTPPDGGMTREKWIAISEMIFGVVFFGLTLVPFYQKYVVPQKRRRVTRRIIGGAIFIDGIALMITQLAPTYFDVFITILNFVLTAFLFLAMYHELGDDGRPRRKRKRRKARWPAWIKKRWEAARPLPNPTPAPRPRPEPA